jgi:hypothetical protein
MNYVAAGIILVVLYSGYVGGLPYILLAIPLYLWMRDKSEREIRKALLLSPVLMLIPLGICYAIYQFGFDPAVTFSDTIKMFTAFFIFFSICTLAFGYFYVGIALSLAFLLSTESKSGT